MFGWLALGTEIGMPCIADSLLLFASASSSKLKGVLDSFAALSIKASTCMDEKVTILLQIPKPRCIAVHLPKCPSIRLLPSTPTQTLALRLLIRPPSQPFHHKHYPHPVTAVPSWGHNDRITGPASRVPRHYTTSGDSASSETARSRVFAFRPQDQPHLIDPSG